jgi:two-component system sensor histidine kinase KdpD
MRFSCAALDTQTEHQARAMPVTAPHRVRYESSKEDSDRNVTRAHTYAKLPLRLDSVERWFTRASRWTQHRDKRKLFGTICWCLIGWLVSSAVMWSAFELHWGLATACFCALVLLVLHSLVGDFAASAALCVLLVLCIDYFFVPPVLSLEVASPLNGLALLSFLFTALIVTRLVSKVRQNTITSQQQHDNLKRLYELAQHLLELEPEVAVGTKFLDPFRGVFGVQAVYMYDGITPEAHEAGHVHDVLRVETREGFMRGRDRDDEHRRLAIRCIRAGGKTTGAIGFEGIQDSKLTAGPLSALASSLLERMHAFRAASRASANAQIEAYRSMILDALAHEFKTPLSTILAAAGALREVGSLEPHHREMAETVESEAARLGRLTSRLIRTARLEREEIKPWMELIDVTSLVADTVEQYSRVSSSRRITLVRRCGSSEVLADPELLRLAVSQLLDNACKYSPAESPVELTVERADCQIAVCVLSTGAGIPAAEKSRIFDRFYRGPDAARVPGTGLGLYVARKIALAHGGNLDLEAWPGEDDGARFRLTIPIPESEGENVVRSN